MLRTGARALQALRPSYSGSICSPVRRWVAMPGSSAPFSVVSAEWRRSISQTAVRREKENFGSIYVENSPQSYIERLNPVDYGHYHGASAFFCLVTCFACLCIVFVAVPSQQDSATARWSHVNSDCDCDGGQIATRRWLLRH